MGVFSTLVGAGLGLWLSGIAAADPGSPTGPWIEVQPGGDTVCARGEPFSFFYAPGRSDKIVVDFIGGGACWNARTCHRDTATFTDSIEDLRDRQRAGLHGVYDRSNPRNPLGDWTHIVVPYCTGDIHWGDNTETYVTERGERFEIQHKGAVNALAVMDWIESNYSSPSNVLVTGCSAGAYGAIYWAPYYRRMFPSANVVQFGDSGTGVITRQFFRESFPRWGATVHAPAWIPSINPRNNNWLNLTLNELYSRITDFYPSLTTSQFNYAHDDVQTFFYEIMGGEPEDWVGKAAAGLDSLGQATPSFRHFLAPGDDHCILPFDEIYSLESNGVKFEQWFLDLVHGRGVETVKCQGEECRPGDEGPMEQPW